MQENNQIVKAENKDREVTPFDFSICPNCGHAEVGKFCPECGQSNKDFNRPIKEIVGELAGSINLDARLGNTLKPFFLKPGYLSNEYFKGKRQRYVPPMRLYMFFSILFFFIAQYTSNNTIKDNILTVNNTEKDVEQLKKEQQAGLLLNDFAQSENNHFIDSVANDTNKGDINFNLAAGSLSDESIEKGINQTLNDTTMSVLQKQMIVGGLKATKNKELFYSRFLNNLSYVLFLLMPVFAIILALILWRSRMLYVKHLIFSINFHSFIFGISSIIMLINMILPKSFPDFENYLILAIPLYLMVGIHNFYNRKVSKSFFKMIGALSLYSVVISIVIIIILLVTAKEFYNM